MNKNINKVENNNAIMNLYEIKSIDDISNNDGYDDINTINNQIALFSHTTKSKKICLDIYFKCTDSNPSHTSSKNVTKSFMNEMERLKHSYEDIDIEIHILDKSQNIPCNYESIVNFVDIEITIKIIKGIDGRKSIYDVYLKCAETNSDIGMCKSFKESLKSNMSSILNQIKGD